MIGSEFAGSFYRCHSERTFKESLNSPGATYLPVPVEKLTMKNGQLNAYACSVLLGLLAISHEGKEMKVPNY